MKRFLLICFSVFLAITAFGCAGRPASEELFCYRDKNITANIEMECNGSVSSFCVKRSAEGEIMLEFTAPTELCGFVISMNGDRAEIALDGMSVEAPEALTLLPRICRKVFSLSPEQVTKVETEKIDGISFTRVVTEDVTVVLDPSGTPVAAEGVLFGARFKAGIKELSVIVE